MAVDNRTTSIKSVVDCLRIFRWLSSFPTVQPNPHRLSRHQMSRVSSTQAECICGEARPSDIGQLLDWNARRVGINHILWFGCIDAVVSEHFTTLARPGGIITHRNFGNLFDDKDPSTLAALSALGHAPTQTEKVYSTAVLVVGHDKCRAIQFARAAVAGGDTTSIPDDIKNWIQPLIDIVTEHLKKNPDANDEELSRLNVNQQVKNIKTHLGIDDSDDEPDKPTVKSSFGGVVVQVWGAYYNVDTGLLRA